MRQIERELGGKGKQKRTEPEINFYGIACRGEFLTQCSDDSARWVRFIKNKNKTPQQLVEKSKQKKESSCKLMSRAGLFYLVHSPLELYFRISAKYSLGLL